MLHLSTIIFMILTLGFVWGGLAFFLRKALRKKVIEPVTTQVDRQ